MLILYRLFFLSKFMPANWIKCDSSYVLFRETRWYFSLKVSDFLYCLKLIL